MRESKRQIKLDNVKDLKTAKELLVSCLDIIDDLRLTVEKQSQLILEQGKTIAEAVRQAGITEQTYYRWRKEYGGMNTTDAGRLRELEKENLRLKRLVADLSLDNAILKDVNSKNF